MPILENLKGLMQNDDVIEQIMHPPMCPSGILNDFRDGNILKNHPLFSEHDSSLQILLYYDEFEVVNPIGSHRKKH